MYLLNFIQGCFVSIFMSLRLILLVNIHECTIQMGAILLLEDGEKKRPAIRLIVDFIAVFVCLSDCFFFLFIC